MTDQRVTYNTQGQSVYASGYGRMPSADYGVNSGISGKVNTNVGGVIVNPSSNLGVGQLTTVPYGVGGTGVAYTTQNQGITGGGTHEYRQTVTKTGPDYSYQQKYKQSRGPASGSYERKIVQTKPVYANTNLNNLPANTPPPPYASTSAYVAPIATSVAAPMAGTKVAAASTPVITRNTYDHQPPAYANNAESQPRKCPKALFGILGFLALAGIILGLLFGLGVFDGKNMVAQPTQSKNTTPVVNEPSYPENSVIVESTVVNSSSPSSSSSTTPPATNTQIVKSKETTSTTSTTTGAANTVTIPSTTSTTITTTTQKNKNSPTTTVSSTESSSKTLVPSSVTWDSGSTIQFKQSAAPTTFVTSTTPTTQVKPTAVFPATA